MHTFRSDDNGDRHIQDTRCIKQYNENTHIHIHIHLLDTSIHKVMTNSENHGKEILKYNNKNKYRERHQRQTRLIDR